MKSLKEILAEVAVKDADSIKDVQVSGIEFDSRKIQKGNVFVAVQGTQVDGHEYIFPAILKGATVIVGEVKPEVFPPEIVWVGVEDSAWALAQLGSAFYGHPSRHLKLVGVTGTNGKTTTVTLLHQLFTGLGQKAGLLSTIENKIGDEVFESTHTTPDSVTINRLLSEMVAAGCVVAFMEVSSHAIDQHRIGGLHFAGGVFTNLTREHLDYHGTMLDYLNVKKKFFDFLPKGSFALANIDDKNGRVMMQNTKADKHTLALKKMADFSAKIQSNSLDGLHLEINGYEVYARLIGGFNAYNLLTAFGVAVLLGESEEEILVVLSGLPGAPGRFEKIADPTSRRMGIIDYAHTPDALEKVLDTINELKEQNARLYTVVGCGGDRDRTKRPIMGGMAAAKSGQAIFTADNPRSEEPEDIIKEMWAGVAKEDRHKVLDIVDRKSAIRTACRLAGQSGIILVAGKGHEKYQIVNGKKLPFDDKAELLNEFLIQN
ncbi:MAG TPA: UDP-N-acetylmuramoyl-L-alanyl-D-glutamate--2,6-diaminopimelate ligase [Saprospiraceae bacterium]|nr:UDP-N-acetylmuramoyl-L-alanyl-D-glutamate--2,6-diaminopimelate ligase [Saprospiraceae bacterium]